MKETLSREGWGGGVPVQVLVSGKMSEGTLDSMGHVTYLWVMFIYFIPQYGGVRHVQGGQNLFLLIS